MTCRASQNQVRNRFVRKSIYLRGFSVFAGSKASNIFIGNGSSTLTRLASDLFGQGIQLFFLFCLGFAPRALGQSQESDSAQLTKASFILDWVSYEFAKNLQFNINSRRQLPRGNWEQLWGVQPDKNRGAQIQAYFHPMFANFLAGDATSRSRSLASSERIQVLFSLYERLKKGFELNQRLEGNQFGFPNFARQQALYEFLYNSMVALDVGGLLYSMNALEKGYGMRQLKHDPNETTEFTKLDRAFALVLVGLRAGLVSEGATINGWIESDEGVAAVDRLATQILHASILQADKAFLHMGKLEIDPASLDWYRMLGPLQDISHIFAPVVQEKIVHALEQKVDRWQRHQKTGFLYAITNEYKGTLGFFSVLGVGNIAAHLGGMNHVVAQISLGMALVVGFIRKLPDFLDGELGKIERRIYFDYLERFKIAKGFVGDLLAVFKVGGSPDANGEQLSEVRNVVAELIRVDGLAIITGNPSAFRNLHGQSIHQCFRLSINTSR